MVVGGEAGYSDDYFPQAGEREEFGCQRPWPRVTRRHHGRRRSRGN